MKIKDFSLRIESDQLLKLHYIARYNDRSVNRELLRLIREYIAQFENQHGVIDIEE